MPPLRQLVGADCLVVDRRHTHAWASARAIVTQQYQQWTAVWTLRSWQSREQTEHTLAYVSFTWPEDVNIKRITGGTGAFARALPLPEAELDGIDTHKTLVLRLGEYEAATQGDRIQVEGERVRLLTAFDDPDAAISMTVSVRCESRADWFGRTKHYPPPPRPSPGAPPRP
eukprot:42812-Prymnesium_polylepis.1